MHMLTSLALSLPVLVLQTRQPSRMREKLTEGGVRAGQTTTIEDVSYECWPSLQFYAAWE